ncbi:hypothetical protein D5073_00135 [Pectobacterium versatile]|nr:hypothetical protein BZY99_00460 [Pectobacterium versatile]PWD70174.1 hypothetical protein DF215_09850 [Pectobacterium versatile]RJL55043.1 hypothetical protein D5076_17695 [Pectobacterium versatile]RJL60010.1 hypothetical protein D5073_00135 [Pectobacterium versatile]RJL62861.1 hypothetical protein D5080_11225 [Pectobacterium versatile]
MSYTTAPAIVTGTIKVVISPVTIPLSFLTINNPPKVSIVLLYPSYFKLHVRWLSSFTRITYLSKLVGASSLAAR